MAAITFQLSVRLILVRGETVQALIRERVLHDKKGRLGEGGKKEREEKENKRERKRIVTDGKRSVSTPLTGYNGSRQSSVARALFRL